MLDQGKFITYIFFFCWSRFTADISKCTDAKYLLCSQAGCVNSHIMSKAAAKSSWCKPTLASKGFKKSSPATLGLRHSSFDLVFLVTVRVMNKLPVQLFGLLRIKLLPAFGALKSGTHLDAYILGGAVTGLGCVTDLHGLRHGVSKRGGVEGKIGQSGRRL